jgi:hypothetical protein
MSSLRSAYQAAVPNAGIPIPDDLCRDALSYPSGSIAVGSSVGLSVGGLSPAGSRDHSRRFGHA